MIREITQQNLYLILPGKVHSLAKLIVKHNGGSIFEALNRIYKSKTYKLLENESSKFWTYGPVALYENLMSER